MNNELLSWVISDQMIIILEHLLLVLLYGFIGVWMVCKAELDERYSVTGLVYLIIVIYCGYAVVMHMGGIVDHGFQIHQLFTNPDGWLRDYMDGIHKP